MAKPIKLPKGREFEFKAGKTGGESKYPWDAWFNGELMLLEQSEGMKDNKGNVVEVTTKKDYDVDTNAMVPKLKVAGRKRYKVVQVSRFDVNSVKLENSLIIRSRDMDEEEKLAEDQLRAEEKALATERREKAKTDKTATPKIADTEVA